MIPDGYRLQVIYDSNKEQFVASVPELGDIKVSGTTRTEALAAAEAEVEKAFRQAAENGSELPKPIDQAEFSGQINLEVSPSLHRELTFLAKRDAVEMNQLCSELLSAGVSIRTVAQQQPNRDNRSRDRSSRHGKRRNNKKYFDIMDDKASFIEYVRNLEGGGGGGGRGGRRGGRGGRRK
jgi:predicted HicB family RNase H-like nuclease